MSDRRRWASAAVATVLLWGGLELALRRSASITDDWMGWRQADTQAIARNLAFEEFDILRPRIDWRRDGPGYVETELQLYPALIAVSMRWFGESPWPGQLMSLAATAIAASITFVVLAGRFGPSPAYAALLAMLAGRGLVVAATSIQPDPLSFLAFTIGMVTFVAWLDAPTRGRLAAWVAATTVAGLVKPTTLELGVAQAALVFIANRPALTRPALWAGWTVVLALVGGYLWHAHGLYVAYGNTFGVLAGGDSKLPTLAALRAPRAWYDLARYSVVWGVGVPAVAAAAYLLWRRQMSAVEVALAAGALCLSLLAFRYTSGAFGTHYHLPHAVLGAWLVAHAVALVPRTRVRRFVVGVTALAAILLFARNVRFVQTLPPAPETVVGELLAGVAPPGTLVAVRARAPRFETEWQTANNFEDPRVFYLSKTRGWVIANDDRGAEQLRAAVAGGARFYAHVNAIAPDAELTAWLAAHASRVASAPEGAVYELPGVAARSPRERVAGTGRRVGAASPNMRPAATSTRTASHFPVGRLTPSRCDASSARLTNSPRYPSGSGPANCRARAMALP